MRRLLASIAAAALLAGPAAACINDVELGTHEREFRSQYGKPPAATPAPADPTAPPTYWKPAAVGLMLLSAAGWLVMPFRRPRG